MTKSFYLIFLSITILCFSCKENTKASEGSNKKTIYKGKDTLWIDFPKRVTVKDSVKFILHYYSNIDTVKNGMGRLTAFYLTDKNLSKKKIENIAQHKNIQLMKKLEFRGKDITHQDSIIFHYKFNETGIHYLTGFIEDRILIRNNRGKKGKTIEHKRFIKQSFMVEKN